jgi:hypothetical protein
MLEVVHGGRRVQGHDLERGQIGAHDAERELRVCGRCGGRHHNGHDVIVQLRHKVVRVAQASRLRHGERLIVAAWLCGGQQIVVQIN